MKKTIVTCCLILCCATTLHAQDKPKIYISADMEGVVGAVTGDQLGPSGFEYQRFREFMTQEVLTAITAAREAGAGEILVSDSHGNGQNLLIDKLPEDVQVIRSWPRPLAMMAGIDASFDGVIFLGYHSSTDNPAGVRAHTMSSASLASVRLNDVPVTEAAINAAIAGHFDVPVIMISGDDAAVKEAQDVIGPIEGAVVKWNYGFHSARTLTPAAGYKVIAARTKAAIRRIGEFKPYKLQSPIKLDVRFKNYLPAEVLSYLSIVERTDSHSIRFIGNDMVEVSKFMTVMTGYSVSITP